MPKRNKVAIIYDDDSDGILSAIILIIGKYHNKSKFLYPSTHMKLATTLGNIPEKLDKLFILDIGLNTNDATIFKIIKNLELNGTRIIWIDTHTETVKAIFGINYHGMICYQKDGAAASVVQTIYGNSSTKKYQQIAAILDKEIIVEKTDPLLKEANHLAAALVGVSKDEEFNNMIFSIIEEKNKSLSELDIIRKYSKTGNERVMKAYTWLKNNYPIHQKADSGPAIWMTDEEKVFRGVSGKALRKVAIDRDSVCMLFINMKDVPGKIRFKFKSSKINDYDWCTKILNIAKPLGGTGGGHPTAFGGWIPENNFKKFKNKVWIALSKGLKK